MRDDETPPTNAAPALGPYSPQLRMGDLIAISGQIGLVGKTLVTTFDGQVRQALHNLQLRLLEAGVTPQDVLKTTVFLVDMDDYPAFNAIYADFFGEHRPARSVVAVAALPLGALVEIEALACAPSSSGVA